ncbi:MAG: sigma 54-interacting transcriptional regulator [Acidobacteriota bacterium]
MVQETNSVPSAIQPRPALSIVGRKRAISEENYECLIGVSPNVSGLKEFIAVQAAHSQPTLVIGDRGLRQESIARALHEASDHSERPFFAVNAHSLSGDALHGLLFGPRGVIETIELGTIYINEFAGLPIMLQQRFAAYLEEQRWRGPAGRFAGQRLIFATEVSAGDRTADNRLAYGLIELLKPNSFTVKPLRERSEDIPYIASHLATKLAKRKNKGACEITPEAMRLLMEYTWDRNIDELESVIEGAIEAVAPQRLDESLLPPRIRHAMLTSIPAEGIHLPEIVDDFERSLIETALRQAGGSQTKASRLLGLRVQTLNMKLKRFSEQTDCKI